MASELSTSVLTLSAESGPDSISITRPLGTVVCLLTADMLAIVLALLLASAFRSLLLHGQSSSIDAFMLPTVVLTLCCFVSARLYPGVSENPVDELRRSVRATILAFLSLWSATYFFHDLSQSRLTFLLACLFTIVLVPSFRALVRKVFANRTWWGCPVAILGMGVTGTRVLHTLLKNPHIGLKPVAVLDDDPAKYLDVNDALTRGPLSRCLEITRGHRISYGIVCMPGLSRKDLLVLLDRYGHCFGHVMVIPDLIGMASLGMCVRDVGGIIGLEVTRQLLRPSAQFAKRFLDLVITLAITPVALPLIALIAILIKLESAGPIFYANERIGYQGGKFKAWKLRSMVVNGEQALRKHFESHPDEKQTWERTQKLKRDPRMTRIGRLLRKTSIDELPQFWNVLKGDMSVVGPRPFLESQIEMYGPSFELYKQVRPGITGLWQVSGRNHLTFKERVQLDAYVIQNWSVWMDIYILARTISVVLTANGAY
jgi:Undecaprenyl-phosphate galactose phosphotransferase WbaP